MQMSDSFLLPHARTFFLGGGEGTQLHNAFQPRPLETFLLFSISFFLSWEIMKFGKNLLQTPLIKVGWSTIINFICYQ